MHSADLLWALPAALTWDLIAGEPSNRWHPVAWFGRAAMPWKGLGRGERRELFAGLLLVIVLPAAWVVGWQQVLALTASVGWLHAGILVFALKSSFSIRALGSAGRSVAKPLCDGDLDRGRRALGALCSRDASTLDASQVAAGAVESLAENSSDSTVAPLFYLALFGLPGALLYRAVNTLDAMVGYRGRFEFLGKASARADDLLNFIPARLTVLLMFAVAAFDRRFFAGRGWKIGRRDAGKTASPNAGWPMAFAAGALGLRLEKPGVYVLGAEGREVTAQDITSAWYLSRTAMLLAAGLAWLCLWMQR